MTDRRPAHYESDIRLEERRKESARIVRELHDTLLQGFLGASMLLDEVVEQTPADSPSKPALRRALFLVRRAIDEGRAAMRGIPMASPAPSSLEQAFSKLLDEVTPGGMQLRVLVQGRPRAVKPAIQEQLFLIGREAVMNALRHSEATMIDVEVHYLHDRLRVLVRDNGRGTTPEAVQKAGDDGHWGLRGMRDRAEIIGARFDLSSSLSAGTKVRVAVPLGGAKRTTHDGGPWEGGSEICRATVASEF